MASVSIREILLIKQVLMKYNLQFYDYFIVIYVRLRGSDGMIIQLLQ